jgi:hypothetical protein
LARTGDDRVGDNGLDPGVGYGDRDQVGGCGLVRAVVDDQQLDVHGHRG